MADDPIVTGEDLGIPPERDDTPINNAFWYRMSRTWVAGAEALIAKQAEIIQSAIKWFFTLGTSATILGLFFKDRPKGEINITWFLVALFCLFLSYAMSTLAVTLSSKSLETPNDPDSIRRAFNRSVCWARFFLVVASVSLVVGMGLIAPALLMAFKDKPDSEPTAVSLNANYSPRIIKNMKYLNQLHVSATINDSVLLHFKIDTGKNLQSAKTVDTFTHYTLHKNLDMVFPVKKCIKVPNSNVYLYVIYSTNADSMASKIVKVNSF